MVSLIFPLHTIDFESIGIESNMNCNKEAFEWVNTGYILTL